MRVLCLGMLGAALNITFVPPVQAAAPCQAYDQAVARAVMIMQVATMEVIPPDGGGLGQCTYIGEVMRNFLGPKEVGTIIRTSIPCEAPLEPGSDANFEVGPTMWKDFEALRDSPYVELHIAPEGGPAGAGAGAVMIDALTDAPARRSACD
jgi:hypothetical protein